MPLKLLISRPAMEAQRLLDELYSTAEPLPGSALDQCGLRNGFQIVDDYLIHGETGLAFEHLLYMISVTSLRFSAASQADLLSAAESLGMLDELDWHLKQSTVGE